MGHSTDKLFSTSAFSRIGATRCQVAQSAPSMEELETDDFMTQVSHAQRIVQMMASDSGDDEGNVTNLLKAQLSHSDGIRGFFVTYLTADGVDTPADRTVVPATLLAAMNESANEKELVSLACMNAIMPTGMVTMHKDPALASQSQKTSERAVRVLRSLLHKAEVKNECEAILAVASASSDGDADSSKVAYWEAFFEKWGYGDTQKRGIAAAIERVLYG